MPNIECLDTTLISASVTTYYIYDGETPILEYDGGTAHTLVGLNVYGKGIDEILERGAYGADNQWHLYYFQQDHEGSITHLTDTSGAMLELYRYDVFGAPSIWGPPPNFPQLSATAYNNRFLFTGREYGPFGFYEYRARAYHPSLGRFMSEDPKPFVRRISLGTSPSDWSFAGHPDEAEFNLFRYCGNDPLDFVDPMGTDYGDPFTSPDAAARDFNKIYNPQSKHSNHEFASHIYKDTAGRYSYAKPFEGSFHDARSRNPIPDHTKLVGDIHSHGDYSRAVKDEHGKPIGIERIPKTDPTFRHDSFRSDHPSLSDVDYWHQEGKGKEEYTGYLSTPGGGMWKQNGVNQSSQPQPMSPAQQKFESPTTLYFIQLVH